MSKRGLTAVLASTTTRCRIGAAGSLVAAMAVTLTGLVSGGVTTHAAAGVQAQPHLAVQNTWFTDADVDPYGVLNDVIPVSGHWFLQEGTYGFDFAQFLAQSQQDVEARLEIFKTRHPEVDPNTDATIIMDIESPHPSDLHTYGPSDQDAIVDAYQTRITAAATIFPNAKLALYGTLLPDPRGRSDNTTYQQRLAALIEAGEEGLFDDLDYLVPVLYTRYGCHEVDGPCDTGWGTVDEYTQLGVDGSRQLKQSDGSGLPLLPLLGFKVFNGSSAFHRELLMNLEVPDPLGATLETQINIFEANSVIDFALWTGTDSNELGDATDPTITDYFGALFG